MSSPPTTSSPPDSTKKSRWGRVGTVIRRSSTAFSVPTLRSSSPSPSEGARRDSDSASIKGTSKPASIKQLDTALLSPPAPAGAPGYVTPSPIAESPMREAAAEVASEPVGPSPLAGEEPVTASPESKLEALPVDEVAAVPATSAAPAQEEEVPVETEAKSQSVGNEEAAPQYTTNPPTEIDEPVVTPSIKVEDTTAEAASNKEEAAAATALDVPAPAGPVHKAASVITQTESVGSSGYFEMPTPRTVPTPTVKPEDYSSQVWQGQAASRGASRKPSIASLAASAGWGNVNSGNEFAQSKASIQMPVADPFADPENVSPTDTIHMPEPMDPRSPRDEDLGPVISMPLPARQDVISGQNMAGGYSVSAQSSVGPMEPNVPATDERIPLLARAPTPQYGPSKTSYLQQDTTNGFAPSIRSANASMTVPRLHAMGWIEYALPDSETYYVHPTMRVITDINLRNLKQLEIVTGYLERNGEGFKVPQGCELWLRDAAAGKRKDCVPVRSWVDHTKCFVSFEAPFELNAGHLLHEHDKSDSRYRYWSFIESHPAHAAISPAAHSEATDALTWSYTERLLPLGRQVSPPFTQEECQELMTLLRNFGASQESSGIQTIVHTRIVARILLRVAHWHQMHFRPQRPLPQDARKDSYTPHPQEPSSLRRVGDFIIGFICLGIPYIFVDRSHHHGMDEESGMHSAGPVLVIGACSCLVAAVILSASVTLISLPGMDEIARIAGFVAILCSAASMTSSVIALFRYKTDIEKTTWHHQLKGASMMISRRSILMSLPLVFLAYAITGFIAGIVIYSIRGLSVTPPMHRYEDYTKWTVVGTLGALAGLLAMSALLARH